MAKQLEVYKCDVCGNVVEVLVGGVGDLVCCDQKMRLLTANTVDASKEKHVPVIEKTANGYKVKVGSAPHPMEEKHYIQWIALCADGVTHRKFLKPGDAPEAEFCITASEVTSYELCNLHELWKS